MAIRQAKKARSLFQVPADDDKCEAWSRLIKRAVKDLDETNAVYDLHFESQFTERTFKTTVKGEALEISRDRPQVAKDASPTIFPGAPSYISKPLPKKRKERNI